MPADSRLDGKTPHKPDAMMHTYNPSHSGGLGRRLSTGGQPGQLSKPISSLKQALRAQLSGRALAKHVTLWVIHPVLSKEKKKSARFSQGVNTWNPDTMLERTQQTMGERGGALGHHCQPSATSLPPPSLPTLKKGKQYEL